MSSTMHSIFLWPFGLPLKSFDKYDLPVGLLDVAKQSLCRQYKIIPSKIQILAAALDLQTLVARGIFPSPLFEKNYFNVLLHRTVEMFCDWMFSI